MLDGSKPVVNIPHIPMQITCPLKAAEMVVEGIKHLTFKGVVVSFDLAEWNFLSFGNLMN